MLDLLRIRNLALIEDAELEFHPGLNVLTGESGAGKSFILRALEFILGQRMGAEMIRSGAERASVEALFVFDGREMVLSREMAADSGRSRIVIDGSLGSQTRVQDLRPSLLLHAGQHGQQQLLRPSFHTRIVDSFLPDTGVLERFSGLVREVQALRAEQASLAERVRDLERQREFLEYQLAEIEKVGPKLGEEEELLAERERLRAEEKSGRGVERCLELLHGVDTPGLISLTEELSRELAGLETVGWSLAENAAHLQETVHVLRDLDREFRASPGRQDPAVRLNDIEARLWELTRLQRKLKRSLAQIVDLAAEIEDNISFLDRSRLKAKDIDRRLGSRLEELAQAAQDLAKARTQASGELRGRLENSLRELGFPEGVRIVFAMEPHQVEEGVVEERPVIHWVPNPGQDPQPLDQIASGGELSRFFLALVGLWGERGSQSLLFDEVDAGIGGMTLNKVGRAIRALADRQQVILITHWPQLAAGADRHFRIEKTVASGVTTTRCLAMDESERLEELARMAGGGDRGLRMAGDLLQEVRA
ncbi:MAG: DNA repair protein RecN [Deltaproteobacteria bacterium]|nr:DNA repair protein RecN [Deltaproteobacteria bacterium]